LLHASYYITYLWGIKLASDCSEWCACLSAALPIVSFFFFLFVYDDDDDDGDDE